MRLWDPSARQDRTTLEAPLHPTGYAAISPDGLLLAIPCQGSAVKLVDVASGRIRVSYDTGVIVNQIAFSSDGGTIATAGVDGTVVLYVADGRERPRLPGRHGETVCLAFAPDGTLAIGGLTDRLGSGIPPSDVSVRLCLGTAPASRRWRSCPTD